MKYHWKTKRHNYISRFMFLGMGRDEDGDTVQVSVSTALQNHTLNISPFYHHNIKRGLVVNWKRRGCWEFVDENC